MVDGTKSPFEVLQSGDSNWVWVRGITAQKAQVTVVFE